MPAPRIAPNKKLRRIREQRGLAVRVAARELPASHVAWLSWEAGEKVPSPPFQRRLEAWTDGAIRVGDWPLPADEAAWEKRLARGAEKAV